MKMTKNTVSDDYRSGASAVDSFITLKRIWVTFQKEGIHHYPEALTDPNLSTGDPLTDVSFLGYPHRHIFHFRVDVSVTDSNREIEFIQLKRWLESLYDQGTLELNNQSCEMIAESLCDQVLEKYSSVQSVISEVSEDGENGSTVTKLRHIRTN